MKNKCNRTIQSVIITSGAPIQFVFTSNNYRQNWTTRSPVANRPLHGFRRHLGCGAVAAKITAYVWEIIQLSTLITPQLHVQF